MPQIDQPLAGARILLLPRYPRRGPSSRLRMYQFIPALEAAGARVTVSPFFDERYLDDYFTAGRKSLGNSARAYSRRFGAIGSMARADLLWIEKELLPFLPGPAERVLRLLPARYVVDYDDAIFHNYDQHPSRLVRSVLGRKLDGLLGGAALVTAGNPYLADYAGRHGARRIEPVPTVVDIDRYALVPQRTHAAPLRVGWIGTPANTRYLGPLVRALNRLAATHPVELVTIGANSVPGLQVPHEAHRWSEEQETSLLTQIDVGVMPLPDDSFERGKCGYKLIQYMAAGRPVIASPVGVNRDIVTDDVGFLAESEDQWLSALQQLLDAPERRIAMGQAGRARVEAHYSLQVTAPRIVSMFASVLKR